MTKNLSSAVGFADEGGKLDLESGSLEDEFENILLEDDSTISLEDGFHITGDSILFEAKSEFSSDLYCFTFLTNVVARFLVIFYTLSYPSFPSTKILSTSSLNMSLIALFKTLPSSKVSS